MRQSTRNEMDRRANDIKIGRTMRDRVVSEKKPGQFLFADPVEKSARREDIKVGDKVCFFRSSDVCNGRVLMNGIVKFVPVSQRFYTVDVGYYSISVPCYRVHKGWSSVAGGYDSFKAHKELSKRYKGFVQFTDKEICKVKEQMFKSDDYKVDAKVTEVAYKRMNTVTASDNTEERRAEHAVVDGYQI